MTYNFLGVLLAKVLAGLDVLLTAFHNGGEQTFQMHCSRILQNIKNI